MNLKESLDKWLTTPPNEANDAYFDSLVDEFSDNFYEANEDWVVEDN